MDQENVKKEEKLRPDGTTRNEDEYGEGDGMHFNNLYDQDEDEAGGRVDLATGERINNSDAKEDIDLEVTIRSEHEVGDMNLRENATPRSLGKAKIAEDAGEKWLWEHDPKHPRHAGKKDKKAM